jgi:hypothetical protein
MPEIDDLEATVNALVAGNSDVKFRMTYRRIKVAFLSAQTATVFNRVWNILRTFRNSIPSRSSLNPVSESAQEVDERLTVRAVTELLGNISGRSRAITNLKAELDRQIAKGNRDESLLRRIREAVERADKTIAEINAMIKQLKETPLKETPDDIIRIFETLLGTIGKVNDIFDQTEV